MTNHTSMQVSPAFCDFKNAVLEHMRSHLPPTREVKFVPVIGRTGQPLFGITIDGVLMDSATVDLGGIFTKAPDFMDLDEATALTAHEAMDRFFDAVPPLREEIESYNEFLATRFAGLADGMATAMFDKLSKNRHKGVSWDNDNVVLLLDRLQEAVNKLRGAVLPHVDPFDGRTDSIYGEETEARVLSATADVANFAAMIADNFDALPESAEAEAENGEGDVPPSQYKEFVDSEVQRLLDNLSHGLRPLNNGDLR